MVKLLDLAVEKTNLTDASLLEWSNGEDLSCPLSSQGPHAIKFLRQYERFVAKGGIEWEAVKAQLILNIQDRQADIEIQERASEETKSLFQAELVHEISLSAWRFKTTEFFIILKILVISCFLMSLAL